MSSGTDDLGRSRVDDEVWAGQAVYSNFVLAVYDLVALRLSCRFVWKCPSGYVLDLYDAHVGRRHLDVGVGTGWFLDRCAFPERPEIVLLDLNENCLRKTSRRIRRYAPRTYRRDVLAPLDLEERGFDSIAINYVIHCLPGNIRSKAVVLDHLDRYLNPGGVIFGSTLLGSGVERGTLARLLMRIYNRKRIFSNTHDDLDDLRDELHRRYGDPHVEVRGAIALFSARKPA